MGCWKNIEITEMANLFDYFQMTKKVSELDSTKARLRLLLEQSVVVSKSNQEQPKSSKNHEKTETTTTKSENHRVHFDLNNATTNSSSSAENIRKPARTSRPNGRSTNVHLPSDARQKLEQLVRKCYKLQYSLFNQN